jgi:hypothetical protein
LGQTEVFAIQPTVYISASRKNGTAVYISASGKNGGAQVSHSLQACMISDLTHIVAFTHTKKKDRKVDTEVSFSASLHNQWSTHIAVKLPHKKRRMKK